MEGELIGCFLYHENHTKSDKSHDPGTRCKKKTDVFGYLIVLKMVYQML